jgi:ribonuclease BN (tRNA processing enzyme)
MKITFLGTNGWFDNENGKTISTLIETEKEYIILDAGFGLQRAKKFIKTNKPIYLYLSHAHIDHVCGLHGLSAFRPPQGITILCESKVRRAVEKIIQSPYTFPLNKYKFSVRYKTVREGKNILPFEFSIFRMKHQDPTYGIRIVDNGKAVAYCCDTAPCASVVKHARRADLLIMECSLPPGKKDAKWGHTSPDDAARMARKSQVKKMI